jgi:hypothetical protein
VSSHSGSSVYFSIREAERVSYVWTFLHLLLRHVCSDLLTLFSWVICFLTIELFEFLTYFGY